MVSCKEYVQIEKDRIRNIQGLNLDIIQIGNDPASNSYIKGKIKDCEELNIKANVYNFSESISMQELLIEVKKIADNNNGIIFSVPVPKHINLKEIFSKTIKSFQDVDGLFYNEYIPCTPRGIIDWLDYNNIQLSGKNILIIGRSEIVGKPLAKILLNRDATITICHSKTPKEQIHKFASIADIIIIAIGQPEWFNFNLLNTPLIIDVGINYKNNKLVGDVNRKQMEAGYCYVTPVPGGVGLLTRLALLKNLKQI